MSQIKKYPVFMDLSNKPCSVVGGGTVAERKTAGLLESGARVKVVAPSATAKIEEWAGTGRIELARRGFEPRDLDGSFLAMAAADKEGVNAKVRREAQKRGVLCNVADRPELCDFFLPSVVSRGRLQIAISTGGASPALASRLKEEIETAIGPEYGRYLEVVGSFRELVRNRTADRRTINRAQKRLFESDTLDRIRKGEDIDIEGLVNKYAG